MTSTIERRQQFADVISLGRDAMLKFASYTSLEGDWKSAIDAWRAEEEVAASDRAAEALDAKHQDEQRRCLRSRRQSELLLADDLLQQTHKELDDLLASSSSGTTTAHPGLRRATSTGAATAAPAVAFQHTESLLSSTAAPREVDAFDQRLPHLVPPSYHSKVEGMLQQLGISTDERHQHQDHDGRAVSATQQPQQKAPTSDSVRLSTRPREAVVTAIQELSELADTLAPHHWTPVLFHCRASCHYALGNIRLALKDSVKALDLCHDNHHVTLRTLAYRRMLRCHIVLMDATAAVEVLAQCQHAAATTSSLSPSDVLDSVAHERSLVTSLQHLREACEHKLWSRSLDIIAKLCAAVPESPAIAEKRVELLATTDDTVGVLDQVAAVTLLFPACGGIWYWYGVLQLKHSNSFQDVENASRSLQRAVSLSGIEGNAAAKQELQKVRYLESKAAMATAYHKSKRWRQAVAELTMLTTLNGVSKGLKRQFTAMRAKAFIGLGRPTECISDSTYLLNHAQSDQEIAEAYLLRAEAHMLGQNREQALKDVRSACGVMPTHIAAAAMLRRLEHDDNNDNGTSRPPTPPPQKAFRPHDAAEGQSSQRHHMPSPPPRARPHSASSARAPPPTPPHYLVLNVAVASTTTVITKAYRDAALKWHPDRWTAASAEERLRAEETFKKINSAYQTLVDDGQRVAYDREHGVCR